MHVGSVTAPQRVPAGMLEPLVTEVKNQSDVLSCLSALAQILEAVEQADEGASAVLSKLLMPQLLQLIASGDPHIKGQAMKVIAL
jgi:hypothetical protein